MSVRLKRLVVLWGIVLLLPGLLALPWGCVLAIMLLEEDPWVLPLGVSMVVFVVVTLGGGGLTAFQGFQALRKRPSRPLRLPPLWAAAGGFVLALGIGFGVQQGEICAPLFLPLWLMVAALVPPVAAMIWMVDGQPGTLTWRRAGVAFVAGATVSVVVAFVLELLLPGVVLLLVLELADPVFYGLGALLEGLASREVAEVLTSPGFLVALVELAVVAPLVEEAVKPVVTLPLLRHLERPRDALLLGAAAGAGFAALENVLYATAGLPIWAGILVVRALGAAVHPFSTGVVTLGWHGLLWGRPDARRRWVGGYGLAIGMHALWNGGTALLLALVGAQFFGQAPPEVDVLGVTVAGSLLALLAIEGVAVFVGARVLARRLAIPEEREVKEAPVLGGLSPDQVIAVWALVCLLALLPVGLAVLQAVW